MAFFFKDKNEEDTKASKPEPDFPLAGFAHHNKIQNKKFEDFVKGVLKVSIKPYGENNKHTPEK